mgnify:CR=1 FL=1
MKLIELLIEHATLSLNRPFTYTYNGKKHIDSGYRVLLDFHNQELVGYVLSVSETNKNIDELEEELGYTLFEIKDVIDESPLLNDDLLALADEMSEYYLASKISILQTMLPPSLSPRRSSLKAPKIAFDQYIVVKDKNEEGLTHKQIELLRLLIKEEKVLKREIKSVSILNKLIELNKVEILKEEKRRLQIPNYEPEEAKCLTNDQQAVVNEFLSSDDSTYLLEGVTGSGKSEVYLAISEEILKQGRSVLMLVPEISLTPMMMEYFIRRFKGDVAILHSELTPAEKYDEYRKIARGECSVVVGARSAIFAPLDNIGLIILDEEHVESYKQDTPPFYNARDVALMRARMHEAKVLLGSATPSLDSRARAQKGLFHLLTLDKRINNQPLPETKIINMLNYSNIDRDSYIFSKTLRKEIRDCLDKKEQAILLLNRRGFSTNVSCRSCGHVFKCPNCGIALTYHKSDGLLKCHHCDYVELLPDTCPECGSKYLMKTGFGSERVEEEVNRLFPDARTLRLDSDSAKVRTRIAKTVEAFRNHEADILIGTQMIAKGHDFPLVTLVGIVLADIGLNMPNYRSSERTFQLITQAVGRCGRKDRPGKAIIQTYMPEHYAITLAARQNFELFYKKEMLMRHEQNYPPYTFLASVSISGKNEEKVISEINKASIFLNECFKDDGVILGPVTPYIAFERNSFVRSLLVKYKNIEIAEPIFKNIINKFSNKSGINISINIDPYNF